MKLSQNLLRNKSIVMAGKGYHERSVCNATILWIQLWPLPGPLAEYSWSPKHLTSQDLPRQLVQEE